MLKKTKILSIKIETDEWRRARLAKFTSSEIHRAIGSGFIRYVREKVGEELTGKPTSLEVETDATRWGLLHESEAIQKLGKKLGIDFLITQQLVSDPNERFGCTPDGIIPIRESPDKTEWEVETVEVKCPPSFANYIELFECETPMDLKKAEPKYYWQCLDQIDNCQSLRHHFVIYHPDFRVGNHKVLTFSPNYFHATNDGKKEYPVYQDLKILKEKKKQLVQEFDRIRAKLMAKPVV